MIRALISDRLPKLWIIQENHQIYCLLLQWLNRIFILTHRDKDWSVSQGLLNRCVIATAPLWAGFTISHQQFSLKVFVTSLTDSPAVSLSLSSLTSYCSPPPLSPPSSPILSCCPRVYKGLWGILLFPWQHPSSTLQPTPFLSLSSLSLLSLHTGRTKTSPSFTAAQDHNSPTLRRSPSAIIIIEIK